MTTKSTKSHELVAFVNGSFSVKPQDSEEAMHSHIGPWKEAVSIYVNQSRLTERLGATGGALVLYDVGMGIAANALAAIECFLRGTPTRDLVIISFEKHLEGLRLAFENPGNFPWLAERRSAIADLLERRQWTMTNGAAQVRWQLREGDFIDEDLTILPAPDLVFFDFYSPKTNPELWGARCFEKIRAVASDRTELITYSASTAARSAMLLAGFFVGTGISTEAKTETTLASTHYGDLTQPLDRAWLDKLARSDKPLPIDWDPAQTEAGIKSIRGNPQFLRL